MRFELRTQIWASLLAVVIGLLVATATITFMMRAVDLNLRAIEASAQTVTGLARYRTDFDRQLTALAAYVLSADSNDRSRYQRLTAALRRQLSTLAGLQADAGEGNAAATDIDTLSKAYDDWQQEIAYPLLRLRESIRPGVGVATATLESVLHDSIELLDEPPGELAEARSREARWSLESAYQQLRALVEPDPDFATWRNLVEELNTHLDAIAESRHVPMDADELQRRHRHARELALQLHEREAQLATRLSESLQHPALTNHNSTLDRISTERRRQQQHRLQESRDQLWLFHSALLLPSAPAVLALALTALALVALRRNLDSINKAARSLAAGDYSVRVESGGYAEFRTLQTAVNRMAASLTERQRAAAVLEALRGDLHGAQRLAEAYSRLSDRIPELLPGSTGGIFLVNPTRTLVESVLVWSPEALHSQMVFGPEDCIALRELRSCFHAVDDPTLNCAHLREPVAAETVCVPLQLDDEVLGLVHVSYPGEAGAGPDAHNLIDLVSNLADLVVRTIVSLRTSERLRDQSIRDPVSGLFNRRYLDATLERELNRARRSGDSLGCIVLDVDHFKRINDQFGHAGGDAVIAEFGRVLQAGVRDGDIVCRYGGEEFVVLLPQATLDNTVRRAEHLLKQVRAMHKSPAMRRFGPITASIGVASYPEHGDRSDTLLRAADQAMYRGKHGGRDRLEVAAPRAASDRGG